MAHRVSLLDALPDLFEARITVLHRRITDLAGQVFVVDPSAFLIFSLMQKGGLNLYSIYIYIYIYVCVCEYIYTYVYIYI